MSKGIITQVIGAVVDVKFEGELPEILTALECKNGNNRLVLDSNAVKISGSSPSNLTSTTAPITCVIIPLLIIINFLLLKLFLLTL